MWMKQVLTALRLITPSFKAAIIFGPIFFKKTFDMPPAEKLRIDKYLWAIRIFKTRSLATAACDEGKVKLNGQNIKPARPVAVGDRYDIKTPARKWTIEVTGLLHNRAGYEDAIKHYVDLTSEEDRQPSQYLASSFYTGKRLSKTGKPTKKQRRDLGDMLGSDGVESSDE
jgi:ribosome-associated heat shock protein Hsp15